ncbi:MAG: aldose sugar dehydrogenase [Alphaproteobacteria bacterium]|jgi:glucose/arabinose dehydrogenase|nr:aldose sugar dehydrogenase [Alphaproteobacteria bacterium]
MSSSTAASRRTARFISASPSPQPAAAARRSRAPGSSHRTTAWAALLLAAATTPLEAQQTVRSSAGNLIVETIAKDLENPWALAFLPDGRMLVTERPGRLRIAGKDGKLSPALAGVPPVFARGQGGLHDVVLDRGFAQDGTIYFCFAEPAGGGGRTALARARLVDEATPRLDDVKVIFHQEGPLSSGNHFGCRIAQASDGNLFLTMGDHFTSRDEAQNLGNHLGKIVRIKPDGSVPPDNPFVGRAGAKPEIWSYGHRNSQGATLHPQTGKLWEHEHGARGGDEINIPLAGKNYGWPVITWGIDYNGSKIGIGTRKAGMEQPVKYWVPSIAPSGMAFYTGDLFAAWRGNLFVGALAGQALVRLEVSGETVGKEERMLQELRERIRDVRQGPDGALWMVTDNAAGRVLRLAPGR